jgi:hypothetical protein
VKTDCTIQQTPYGLIDSHFLNEFTFPCPVKIINWPLQQRDKPSEVKPLFDWFAFSGFSFRSLRFEAGNWIAPRD